MIVKLSADSGFLRQYNKPFRLRYSGSTILLTVSIQTRNKLDLRIFETLKVYKLKKKISIILLSIHAFCAIASKIYLISNIIKLGQGLTTLLADGLLL